MSGQRKTPGCATRGLKELADKSKFESHSSAPIDMVERLAGLDLTDEEKTLARLILSASDPEPPKVYETPEERRKFDLRDTEDRLIPHKVNVVRKWRDEAKWIEDTAPAIPSHGCLWHVAQIADDNPELLRTVGSKCGTLTCSHCAPLWHSRRISDALDVFADCAEVTVLALDDDEARLRFAERHKKRRQRRAGIPLAKHDLAMVLPVADGRFFVIAGHADRAGERVPLGDALAMLNNAISDRIALAKLTGKDTDGRKVSWPGKPRKSKEPEDVPIISVEEQNEGDIRDIDRTWTTIGGTDEALTAETVGAVLDGDGIAAKVTKKRNGELRIHAKDMTAAIDSLTKSFNLRDKDGLDETNADRSARIAWENEQANCQPELECV